MSGEDLAKLAKQMQEIVDVADRQYGFPIKKTYKNCFIGEEAVDAMVRRKMAKDEDDALRIGNMLLNDGYFAHVLKEHSFKNEFLFYRFADKQNLRLKGWGASLQAAAKKG